MLSDFLGTGGANTAMAPAEGDCDADSFVGASPAEAGSNDPSSAAVLPKQSSGVLGVAPTTAPRSPSKGKPSRFIIFPGAGGSTQGGVVPGTVEEESSSYASPSLTHHLLHSSQPVPYDDRLHGSTPITNLPLKTYRAFMMAVDTPEEGQHPADLCILDCMVAGVDTSALVDSGAQANIIGREVLRKLNAPLRTRKVNMRVIGANAEHPLNIHGVTEINIGLRGEKNTMVSAKISAIVTPDFEGGVVLSLATLCAWGVGMSSPLGGTKLDISFKRWQGFVPRQLGKAAPSSRPTTKLRALKVQELLAEDTESRLDQSMLEGLRKSPSFKYYEGKVTQAFSRPMEEVRRAEGRTVQAF